MRALETIALTSGSRGKYSVQALSIPYPDTKGHLVAADKHSNNCPDLHSCTDSTDSSSTALHDSIGSSYTAPHGSSGSESQIIDSEGGTRLNLAQYGTQLDQRGDGTGATAFALKVAEAYSCDDSRTIVRREGAARVAVGALGLLRVLLADAGELQEGHSIHEGPLLLLHRLAKVSLRPLQALLFVHCHKRYP